MNRNNGRRGRGRGRGRRGANRGRNAQNGAAPGAAAAGGVDFDLTFSDASSDTDSDDNLLAGMAIIQALSTMRRGFNPRALLGPDPGSGSDEKVYYTEDNIPVSTIYASFNINPESVTEESVRKLFGQFGTITGVRIHTSQNTNNNDDNPRTDEEAARGGRGRGRGGRRGRSRNAATQSEKIIRYGFVSFERCEDAAKCLQKKHLLKKKCYVAPADSWHQDAYKKQKRAAEKGSRPAAVDSAVNSNTATGSGSGSVEGASVAASKEASKTESDASLKAAEGSNSEEATEQTGMNVLQLNDDCLLLICDYLELSDLLSLKKTCTRLENITCEVFKRYRILDFDIDPCEKRYLTMLDAKNILTEVGSYIEYLLISRDRFMRPGARVLSMIPRYCPNLKDLDINDFTLNFKALKGFEELFKSLEGLSLSSCSLDDNIEQSLSHATKLQRLDLSMNNEIRGKCLASIQNLKHLNVENCQNLQGKPFMRFAARNKTLEYLNISGCARLTADAIKSIASNMPELTHLVCNNTYENVDAASLALLGKLPNLKNIQFKINGYTPIDQILEGFAAVNKLEHLDMSEGVFTALDYKLLSNLTHLKELKLNYKLDLGDEQLALLCNKRNFVELHIAGCTKVTDQQLLEFIRKNPQLKVLDISYCQITEGLIFSAIDILKEQAVGCREGSRQLRMMVGQTSICPVIKNNTLIQANKHLLDVSFDSTEGFYSGMDDDMYDDVMDDEDDFMGYEYGGDFMGYDDYGDDDSLLWGLDYDSDLGEFADVAGMLDSDDDDRFLYYM